VRGLEKLLIAISKEWPQDKTRPGIVLAYLRSKGSFYASIVRYRQNGEKDWQREKLVQRSATTPHLVDALSGLNASYYATKLRTELKQSVEDARLRKPIEEGPENVEVQDVPCMDYEELHHVLMAKVDDPFYDSDPLMRELVREAAHRLSVFGEPQARVGFIQVGDEEQPSARRVRRPPRYIVQLLTKFLTKHRVLVWFIDTYGVDVAKDIQLWLEDIGIVLWWGSDG
jgi:hypothetical protein